MSEQDGTLTFSGSGLGSVFATAPSTGAWHSIVGTYDGSNLDLYIDGSLVAQQAATGAVPTSSSDLTIGGDASGNSFAGTIEEAQVYNYAVPASQISSVLAGPTVATGASASTSTITGTTVNLSVLGASAEGESNLTYTWVPTSVPTGAADPFFSDNGDNSAKSVTATFFQAGSYTFEVQISDGTLTTTSTVSVQVNQTLTSLFMIPGSATVASDGTYQLSATVLDQFGNALVSLSASKPATLERLKTSH